jgi:hypothetical protein
MFIPARSRTLSNIIGFIKCIAGSKTQQRQGGRDGAAD